MKSIKNTQKRKNKGKHKHKQITLINQKRNKRKILKNRKANEPRPELKIQAKRKNKIMTRKSTSSHPFSCFVTVPREQARSCNFGLQTKKHRMNLSGS